ncbi:MAG: peptidylprolyl isomerase [Acidobacteriota bacterium]
MKRFMALCWLMCGATIFVFSQTALEPRTAKKQVVLETALGSIVLEVFPDAAPNHVEKFLERMQNNFYVGTVFHRVVPRGLFRGGIPFPKILLMWISTEQGGCTSSRESQMISPIFGEHLLSRS